MKNALIAATLAAVVTTPAFAQDEASNSIARDGFRFEARASYETPTVSSVIEDDDIYKLGSAFALGGEVGFDVAVSRTVVVGPYATYEFSNIENCDGSDCVRAKNNFAAGLHVGVATGESGQVYGKVGYATMKLEGDIATIQTEDSGSGVQFAAGYEHGFGSNAYGRIEFGYADNGQIFGLNFQRRHAGVALGVRF